MTLEEVIAFNRDMVVLGNSISVYLRIGRSAFAAYGPRITALADLGYIKLLHRVASNCWRIVITDAGIDVYNAWHMNLISTLRLHPTNGVSEQEESTIRSRWEDVKGRRATATPPASAPTAWNVERLLGA
jgi:hypothetical protein